MTVVREHVDPRLAKLARERNLPELRRLLCEPCLCMLEPRHDQCAVVFAALPALLSALEAAEARANVIERTHDGVVSGYLDRIGVLKRELEAAERDRERLDWLDRQGPDAIGCGAIDGARDAARRAEGEGEK